MKKLVGIICLVLGFAANASAAEITGTLNFTGDVIVVSDGQIDWRMRRNPRMPLPYGPVPAILLGWILEL